MDIYEIGLVITIPNFIFYISSCKVSVFYSVYALTDPFGCQAYLNIKSLNTVFCIIPCQDFFVNILSEILLHFSRISTVLRLHQNYNSIHEANCHLIFFELVAYTQTIIRNQCMIIQRIFCSFNAEAKYFFP